MGGDTSQLQRLTDEQVSARLAAYNPKGSLERDIRYLWEEAGEIIEEEFHAKFGPDAAARIKAECTGAVNSGWVQDVAEHGRRIYRDRSSVPAYIAARDELITRIIGRLFERFAEQPETLRLCVSAFQRLTSFETDIILAQVALLEAIEAADERGRESEQFERRVADLVRASTDQSKALTEIPATAGISRSRGLGRGPDKCGRLHCSGSSLIGPARLARSKAAASVRSSACSLGRWGCWSAA